MQISFSFSQIQCSPRIWQLEGANWEKTEKQPKNCPAVQNVFKGWKSVGPFFVYNVASVNNFILVGKWVFGGALMGWAKLGLSSWVRVQSNPSGYQTSQWLKMKHQLWTRFQRLLRANWKCFTFQQNSTLKCCIFKWFSKAVNRTNVKIGPDRSWIGRLPISSQNRRFRPLYTFCHQELLLCHRTCADLLHYRAPSHQFG